MLKVLVVEDDLMIADAAEELLVRAGYAVCGIARTAASAIALAEAHKPDLLVIDLRLAGGGLGSHIPRRLRDQAKCGILYASGNMANAMLTDADGDACLAKPYCPVDLLRSLELVREIAATGRASQPIPRGFHVLSPAVESTMARSHG